VDSKIVPDKPSVEDKFIVDYLVGENCIW
jgi:hypothetical protein